MSRQKRDAANRVKWWSYPAVLVLIAGALFLILKFMEYTTRKDYLAIRAEEAALEETLPVEMRNALTERLQGLENVTSVEVTAELTYTGLPLEKLSDGEKDTRLLTVSVVLNEEDAFDSLKEGELYHRLWRFQKEAVNAIGEILAEDLPEYQELGERMEDLLKNRAGRTFKEDRKFGPFLVRTQHAEYEYVDAPGYPYIMKYRKNGEVCRVGDSRRNSSESKKAVTPTPTPSPTPKQKKKSSGSSKKKVYDPDDIHNWDDPDDFWYDHEDEFDDYEDALDYWEENT